MNNQNKNKLVEKAIDYFHGFELMKIQILTKMPFGTSCLIVAQKENI